MTPSAAYYNLKILCYYTFLSIILNGLSSADYTDTASTNIQDSVTLLPSKNFSKDEFVNLDIDYHLQEYNDFHIYGFYIDTFGKRTTFYQYSLQQSDSTGNKSATGSVSLEINIPKSVVYFDHQNVNFPTNYFVNNIQVAAKLVLLDLSDMNIVTSVDENLVNITIPNPWDRKEFPHYCLSWAYYVIDWVNKKQIPTCETLESASIFRDILPISRSGDGGYIREVQHAKWPSHLPKHFLKKQTSYAVYTLSFWMFLTEKCHNGHCFVLQQRNTTSFHGIIMLINQRGRLHIQLHDRNGNGQAFISDKELPTHAWIFVMLKVNHTTVEFHISSENFVHKSVFFGHYTYTYGGKNSLWVLGGYFSSNGFPGFIAKAMVNRFTLLDYENFISHHYYSERKELENMISKPHYSRCINIREHVRSMIYKQQHKGQCTMYPLKDPYICPIKKKSRSTLPHDLNQQLLRLKDQMKDKFPLLKEFGSYIHDVLLKNMSKGISPSFAPLLEASGCLGYTRSYFLLATMSKYGVDKDVEPKKALQYHLIAAQEQDPLSHLALAYRYQLGLDGLIHNVELQAGFTRQAAISAKRHLDTENHEIDPLDLTVNKAAKAFIQNQYNDWFSRQLKGGKDATDIKISSKLSDFKPLHASWIVYLYNHMRKESDIITKGFKEAGIYDDINDASETHSELIRLDQARSFDSTRGESSELYKWLSQQARMGSLEAKNQMADMLFHGKHGVQANPLEAIQNFQELAQAGDPVAMVNLAILHLKGVNVEKNISLAKDLLKKSVARNSTFAYNVLGFIELHFNGNQTSAISYWKKGIKAGDVQCMFNYANVMEQSNHTESLIYYEKAVSLGDRHSHFRLAELLMEGVLISRNVKRALSLYKFIAEQHQDIGWFMRNAINMYLKDKRYSSLLNHLFALESGLQLAGYNIALLLKEMEQEQDDASKYIVISDSQFYVNFTAELGWSTSLKEMGDHTWMRENDTKKASLYYFRAIEKSNHPEAFYNLAYMVEHGLSIDARMFNNLTLPWQIERNLTLAMKFLESCMATDSEGGEGYYPCQLALLKVQCKLLFTRNFLQYMRYEFLYILLVVVIAIPIIIRYVMFT